MVVGGIVLVAVAVGALVWSRITKNRLDAMAGAETVGCADLASLRDAAAEAAGPGAFNYVCEVTGDTEPGEGGLLNSELSKTECVWHRHIVRRKYESVTTDAQGRRQRSTRTETVAELSSSAPFHLRDASGRVLVDPAGADPDRPEQVVNRFEPRPPGSGAFDVSLFGISLSGNGRDSTLGYEYEEWVVRPGRRLYVLGEASDRSGRLVVGKPSKGPYVVSTRSEEELAGNARTQQRLAAIGAAVAGVAGVVLLVAGLIA
jgi:hypothetical protein